MMKRFWNYCKALRDQSKNFSLIQEQCEQEFYACDSEGLKEYDQRQERIRQMTAEALYLKAQYQKTLSAPTYISDETIFMVILWMAAIIGLAVLLAY